jgi:hypothetical protein
MSRPTTPPTHNTPDELAEFDSAIQYILGNPNNHLPNKLEDFESIIKVKLNNFYTILLIFYNS